MDSAGLDRRTFLPLQDFDHVVQSVEVIFNRRLGETIMLRHFASGLPDLLGRAITPTLIARYKSLLALAINTWEPRLRVALVSLAGNSASAVTLGELRFTIFVRYRPRALSGDFTPEAGLRRIGYAAREKTITVEAVAT